MSIGNHELIEYEERNHDELVEQFMEENSDRYNEFVLDAYNDECASHGDITKDQAEDMMLEEARERDMEKKNGSDI